MSSLSNKAEPSEKPKKTLSSEQLEKLKVAREKALSVRQENAKNKALEKELATAEKEQHLNTVKEKLAKVKAPKQEAPKIEVQADSEPESEPEVIVKKKKPKKKKIVIVEDSESDEEQQQVIFVKRKKDNPLKAIQEPVQVPQQVFAKPPIKVKAEEDDDPYQRHYNAIFGRR